MVLVSYVPCTEKTLIGERMELRLRGRTCVFDVQFEMGNAGSIAVSSGAGVHVYPEDWLIDVPMLPKLDGLRMRAAKGAGIRNFGLKLIRR